uniref:30S ribosomal protein S13 n=1 Tax=Choreocolax polysiphoniae TaxID=282351 RepID=A0A0B5W2H9_9FLOR|nr:30S ribosomal protein S13 [Choreocolax polysiphoniae]AJH65854.1 30S ribosomal protein S13 [Choreocolax polysiphoniae]
MIRIQGVDLPKNKKVYIGLMHIYGIGLSRSKEILLETKIESNIKVKDLNDQQIILIKNFLNDRYLLEIDLKRIKKINIRRLIEIKSYRGKRHKLNLPVRGQRTKTNAKTIKSIKKIIFNNKISLKE